MDVKFVLVRSDSILPEAATEGSSGYDCYADMEYGSITIFPGDTHLVPLGFSLQLKRGLEGQLRSRSGLAYRDGIIVLNSPGTIDSDYTGEVKALLHNSSKFPATIAKGQRVCQLVIAPVLPPHWTWYDNERQKGRGTGGFGSTGDF